jgi:hypothetical protein
MKVILSVPDEGYSERTWWRLFWAYLMKVILSVPKPNYWKRNNAKIFGSKKTKEPKQNSEHNILLRLNCDTKKKTIM